MQNCESDDPSIEPRPSSIEKAIDILFPRWDDHLVLVSTGCYPTHQTCERGSMMTAAKPTPH